MPPKKRHSTTRANRSSIFARSLSASSSSSSDSGWVAPSTSPSSSVIARCVPPRFSAARAVDEDVAHGDRRDAQEVSAVLPRRSFGP
jgi:hypothetical protein